MKVFYYYPLLCCFLSIKLHAQNNTFLLDIGEKENLEIRINPDLKRLKPTDNSFYIRSSYHDYKVFFCEIELVNKKEKPIEVFIADSLYFYKSSIIIERIDRYTMMDIHCFYPKVDAIPLKKNQVYRFRMPVPFIFKNTRIKYVISGMEFVNNENNTTQFYTPKIEMELFYDRMQVLSVAKKHSD